MENVTTFDQTPKKSEEVQDDNMEVDSEVNKSAVPTLESKSHPPSQSTSLKVVEESKSSKSVTFNAKTTSPETPLDADSLYPVFWALQESFSQPKKLFAQEHFLEFKTGLEATMTMFKTVRNEQQTTRGLPKSGEENKRGVKRKRGQGDEDLAKAFNPKYLTSRDLFELEVGFLSV